MDYDAIVVGGGHNGLVAAFYLAAAGRRVLVLERREKVGGAAVTDEIFPGFHFSTCAHRCVLLQPRIIRDMRLKEHGLRILRLDPTFFQPFADGSYFFLWQDEARSREEIARISPRDAAALPRWDTFWEQAADILAPYFLTPPPTLAELAARHRGRPGERVLEALLTRSMRSLLDEYFESEKVKQAMSMSFDMGSKAPGAALYGAFHAAARRDLEAQGDVGYPQGGMGGLTQAMARSARAQGVVIQTSAEVERILVRNGAAVGVRLGDGAEMGARVVLANADPKRTFLRLVGPEDLDEGFRQAVRSLHTRAGYLKLHCAIRGLPDWRVLPGTAPGPQHRAQARINESLDRHDQAWERASAGEIPETFCLGLINQAMYDPSLAPPGCYTLSVWVEYVPVRPRGRSWESLGPAVSARIIDQVSAYAPNFRDIIQDCYLWTPAEMERKAGLTDGNMHHLDMTPDQMLDRRPLAGWASYRTPIRRLYLCGSGTHPGGGVTGAPGHNAAQMVLADWPGL